MNNNLQGNQLQKSVAPNQQLTSGAMMDSNKAIAEIQSAMTIAKHFPRNQITAIEKIENAFQRKTLAEVSQYQYQRGGNDITGPSIRSAEAIAQLWGNMQFGFRELHRGKDENGVGFSEIEAYAWDVESNTKRPTTFIVKHWRDTKKGGYGLTDERDIYELTANMAQRRVRACIIAVIPGDVFDAAMATASSTLSANADTTPEGVNKMCKAFLDQFGVTKDQIESRIQRKITAIQPAQVVNLKRIYSSLRDGMSNPSDWFEDATDEKSSATGAKANASAQDTGSGSPARETKVMTDDEFMNLHDIFKRKIESGAKTADEMIAWVETKGSILTDEQKKTVTAFKPIK